MPMKPPAEDDAPVGEADQSPDSDAIAGQIDAAVEQADAVVDEVADLKDRMLRLTAELENTRSRGARELIEERKYASLSLARDLLPVVDNVDRAIEAADKSGEATPLLEGFRLVRQQLLGVLAQHQCEPIDALGQPFDPQFHEAILQQPSEDVEANHVMMVTQCGYRMHDRVVRASQVIVSSGPPEQ
ncbi:nucleotide exchange factor GrpE [Adhaeretor mobilis]|uniref:Protein GrpE n=1 Tax=Adhaeretor mobilis TaxID=1930276 RepID=A0A517MVM4_9BACT|nr:nucleotide exchange factor GrpE [Adhaeretor mobilis]QDS98919.1 heat shock protein GrpE [Adhaeretor mobilis]